MGEDDGDVGAAAPLGRRSVARFFGVEVATVRDRREPGSLGWDGECAALVFARFAAGAVADVEGFARVAGRLGDVAALDAVAALDLLEDSGVFRPGADFGARCVVDVAFLTAPRFDETAGEVLAGFAPLGLAGGFATRGPLLPRAAGAADLDLEPFIARVSLADLSAPTDVGRVPFFGAATTVAFAGLATAVVSPPIWKGGQYHRRSDYRSMSEQVVTTVPVATSPSTREVRAPR